ncbi:MAG: Chemotaxis protein methyltransferase CheR [Candidatus Methanosuratincola subterraneus]|uniref:Protein-glutamate O-methyltransferase CheR n=2 Tax=Candidatus Methanosuratincola (ex Vanwonterghem et al. 2016) TaxID=1915412 RepID=A0A7J3V0R6_9CREN|nr:MAG: Chemotaxis protein methyltransferase CheR [Candidatus Methanosuratincola subterraneus]
MNINDAELIELVRFLLSRGVKVDGYKADFLKRRICARMALTKSSTPNEYLGLLMRDNAEAKALVDSISINVSEFYRDPPVWEGIRRAMREKLKEKAESGLPPTLRIWSAGCSCGEEAYTAAIVALEAMRESGIKEGKPTVVATDVDRDALNKGSLGIYPQAAMKKVPSTLLAKYFISNQESGDRAANLSFPLAAERGLDAAPDNLASQHIGKKYSVREEVKNAVRFRIHDLFKDPPLPFMDLILCRNVLIYVSSEMQKKILEKLSFALVQGGFLVLGMNEVIFSNNGLLLEPYDPRLRIYRRVQKTSQLSPGSQKI